MTWDIDTRGNATQEMERLYPLPKVERPRVVRDEYGTEWRVTGVELEYKGAESPRWSRFQSNQVDGPFIVSNARIALWADLLATPTETADAD